jgi:uncharacterized protein
VILILLKIGVISDTHIHDLDQASRLVDLLMARWFSDVDMILHAGDMVTPALLDLFCGLPVHAVRGNMDPNTPGIPFKKVIRAGGFRFGLIHGWGSPETLEPRLQSEFENGVLDCLIYGHSHCPCCHYDRSGMLLFNPGSATDRRSAPAHTVGILEVGDCVRGRIIQID